MCVVSDVFIAQFEQLRGTTAYKLPNYNKAKRLWKLAVEHHAFFRYISLVLLLSPVYCLALININVKKLQFIHKLTASDTSKTAKITKR